MVKRIISDILAIVLVVLTLLSFSGCSESPESISDDVAARQVQAAESLTDYTEDYNGFSVRLFNECYQNGNTLISPMSVLSALSMTANGAEGETLKQMETALGMDKDSLNTFFYTYMQGLSDSSKDKLSLANSLWINDNSGFDINEDFLQFNADYYSADIFEAPFDSKAVDKINAWVGDKTKGMIPKVIDKLDPDAVMSLINALAFEAEWEAVYDEHSVTEAEFVTEDGKKQDIELMRNAEGHYLEDENATGFLKFYEDHEYAFAALLPDEGVSVEEYIATLDGEGLTNILKNASEETVRTAIPKFESGYSASLVDMLKNMGMTDAFNGELADFSQLGKVSDGNNIYIGDVIHETKISVAEQGTKAGAVTAVIANTTGAIAEPKEVILDRPFVYMLIDAENNIPLFIGALMSVSG